ncbi:MAG: hypothetical protein U1E49_01750 [Hyphomicrobiaceae bacterium]
MHRVLAYAAVITAALALAIIATPAMAGAKKKSHRTVAHLHGKAVGGYSYGTPEAITDYRDRSILRDPNLDGQGGPFDSGYFFNSTITRVGSESPYLN